MYRAAAKYASQIHTQIQAMARHVTGWPSICGSSPCGILAHRTSPDISRSFPSPIAFVSFHITQPGAYVLVCFDLATFKVQVAVSAAGFLGINCR